MDVSLTQVQTCDNADPFGATFTVVSEQFWSFEYIYLLCDKVKQLRQQGNQTRISQIKDYQNMPHLVNVLLMDAFFAFF